MSCGAAGCPVVYLVHVRQILSVVLRFLCVCVCARVHWYVTVVTFSLSQMALILILETSSDNIRTMEEEAKSSFH